MEDKKEKKYKIIVTAYEAWMLSMLRIMPDFGQMIVYKHKGKILRIESTNSELVNPQIGENAAIDLGGQEVVE